MDSMIEEIKQEIIAASTAFNKSFDRPYVSPNEIWIMSNRLSMARKKAIRLIGCDTVGAVDVDTWLIQLEELGRLAAISE